MPSLASPSVSQLIDVAHVAMASANLERTVDLIIGSLVGLSDSDYAEIAGGKMLRAKLELAKALAPKKLKVRKAKLLASLISNALNLTTKRNAVIHGSWQPKGGFRLKHLSLIGTPAVWDDAEWIHGRANKQPIKVSVKELETLGDEITVADRELYDLWVGTWVVPKVRRKTKRKSAKQSRPPE